MYIYIYIYLYLSIYLNAFPVYIHIYIYIFSILSHIEIVFVNQIDGYDGMTANGELFHKKTLANWCMECCPWFVWDIHNSPQFWNWQFLSDNLLFLWDYIYIL